ncbi:MAG: AAA family ATPase [Clostridia bacterium]|nr:AAA family ATPase [Clostridia bacterium]
MTRVIAVANQKGGVGKTTTTESLGIGLAQQGKRVLLVDADPQGSLTIGLGYREPDRIEDTMYEIMQAAIEDSGTTDLREATLHHAEGVDLLPANIRLAAMEMQLLNVMMGETIMQRIVESVKTNYDYVIIDCMPSLGLLTINALTAADSVIIPVQAQYLSARGLEQLLQSIAKIRKRINPLLQIGGILTTMIADRTNIAKDITALIQDAYGANVRIYSSRIPQSVRVAESAAKGCSIYTYDGRGKAAKAYRRFVEEVMRDE